MSKDKAPVAPVVYVLGRKVDGHYEVVRVEQRGAERTEEVLRSTADRRIAADKLSAAFAEVFR
jgi:hypothetical protein